MNIIFRVEFSEYPLEDKGFDLVNEEYSVWVYDFSCDMGLVEAIDASCGLSKGVKGKLVLHVCLVDSEDEFIQISPNYMNKLHCSAIHLEVYTIPCVY